MQSPSSPDEMCSCPAGFVVPMPILSALTIVSSFLLDINPNLLHLFSVVKIQPAYPLSTGFAERTTSPAAPPTDGVAIPTVIFLATLPSPCSCNDTASIPSTDVDVTLLVKIDAVSYTHLRAHETS